MLGNVIWSWETMCVVHETVRELKFWVVGGEGIRNKARDRRMGMALPGSPLAPSCLDTFVR